MHPILGPKKQQECFDKLDECQNLSCWQFMATSTSNWSQRCASPWHIIEVCTSTSTSNWSEACTSMAHHSPLKYGRSSSLSWKISAASSAPCFYFSTSTRLTESSGHLKKKKTTIKSGWFFMYSCRPLKNWDDNHTTSTISLSLSWQSILSEMCAQPSCWAV